MTRSQKTRMTDCGFAVLVFTTSLLWGGVVYTAQLSLHGSHFFLSPSGLLLHDFAFFWGGARLFWLGHVSQVFDPALFNAWLADQIAPGSMPQYSTWSYPPTMLLLLLPFGLFPLPVALLLWVIGTFAMLGLVLRNVFAHGLVALTVILSPASLFTLSVGQNGALTRTSYYQLV